LDDKRYTQHHAILAIGLLRLALEILLAIEPSEW